MLNTRDEVTGFVKATYGFPVNYSSEHKETYESGDGVEEHCIVYEVMDSNGVAYYLLYSPDESIDFETIRQKVASDIELEGYRQVKEWQELIQKVEQKNFVMHKAVPLTVNGLPVEY
ncbi:MAG: hypothetical protein WDZ42_00115 [Candidatus Saccharimonadales bacterium]